MADTIFTPDYLFETSWEVCNKVGGVHTVLVTKANTLVNEFKSNYILIGPDVWREDEASHPEFSEDEQLFRLWKKQAANEGLRIRTGRWNIPGNPIAIIVDFTTFIAQKDPIFTNFWEIYKLDSLSGEWDYIEPALFGYAAGKIIESFTRFNITKQEKVIAHFHEWLTGTGILYLKQNMPQVGTIFTAHSTVLGRSLASNNRPLYANLEVYNGEEISRELNLVAKHSLEKLSVHHADICTTLSEVTAKECKYLLQKEVDYLTPNGFDESFVPAKNIYNEKRKEIRGLLLKVSESLLGYKLSKDTKFLLTSGRYEFKNKGIDLFIDSISSLNQSGNINKEEIVAFVLIPANHYGPKKDLLAKLNDEHAPAIKDPFVTHDLHDPEYDVIFKKISEVQLKNSKSEKVKIIFVPSYLNGNDGIFNRTYYDLLLGTDLTLFPSYYEPWGYTPHESISFGIPTIVSSLSGFGNWIQKNLPNRGNAAMVIERTDENDVETTTKLHDLILNFYSLNEDERGKIKSLAFEISKNLLWKQQIKYYKQAYSKVLNKVEERSALFIDAEQTQTLQQDYRRPHVNEPSWNRLIVQSGLPDKLKLLDELSGNLWYTWDFEAVELFEEIDPELWKEAGHNPAYLFEKVDYERLMQLQNDPQYLSKLNAVYKRFKKYMAEKDESQKPLIAYFSMEYGLHDTLKIYSGGLGLLAGDYLKEASDSNFNLIAVGLLYRYGYFKQMISIHGEQLVVNDYQHFSKLPITPVRNENGNYKTISIMFPGRAIVARIWLVKVGRIDLYLLDTDFESNIEQDRYVTHHLYGGDNENRLKQELLLGIGGIRLLETLGIKPDLFHSNEGHSAFISIERLRRYIGEDNLSFPESRELVRATTLFTTHTPVPAGHDSFPEDLLRTYIAHYPSRLKISWNDFINLGKAYPDDPNEKFNMSYLAANLCQEINGVSLLHGKVTQEMFAKLWKGYLPEELHVSYVTNGVHLPTWVAKEWRDLYRSEFGEGFFKDQTNSDYWQKIYNVSDDKIWEIKQTLREQLIEQVKDRFRDSLLKRYEDPKQIMKITENLNGNILTICFARRFATYKRAHLLFKNLERLSKIVNNPERPVQFIFAGKAHPHDKAGQELIKMIVGISKRPEFIGKIIFLQNYDITLAKKLVQGSDIWLNTPTRPLEASGTSGEKAVMNGTLHFSVLDGWWVEGYQEDAGWALPQERTFDNQEYQDELDAETVYSIFENEVIPAFYNRNVRGIPLDWVGYVKNSIAHVAPKFTTRRMITDYYDRFYNKMYKRAVTLQENDFEIPKRITAWKKNVGRNWEKIELVSCHFAEGLSEIYQVGKKYSAEVVLDLKDLSPEEIGVEVVITENKIELIDKIEFEFSKSEGTKAWYNAEIVPTKPGSYTYGFRIFPKNPDLPHRQDFRYLRWI